MTDGAELVQAISKIVPANPDVKNRMTLATFISAFKDTDMKMDITTRKSFKSEG